MAGRYKSGHRWRTIRAQVLAQEEYCSLCGEQVDKNAPRKDEWGRLNPAAPVVDHITPLALGGDPYDRNNLALAHQLCNARKGARTSVESPRTLYPPSIQW